MKNNNNIFVICALIVSSLFVSCKDEEQAAPNYTLSEFSINGQSDITEITATLTDNSGTISFVASSIWDINVDKLWIELDKSTGAAGEHTINYRIEQLGNGFDDSQTGLITFVTGGEPKTVNVTRTPLEREIAFSDFDDTPIESLVIQHNMDANTYFVAIQKISANFDWIVTGLPSWISGPSVDSDGFATTFSGSKEDVGNLILNVNVEALTTGALADSVVFSAKGGSFTKELPITFVGVDDDFVNTNETLPFALTFTGDGYFYDTQGGVATDVVGQNFKITSVGTDVGIIRFGVDAWGYVVMNEWSEWITIAPEADASSNNSRGAAVSTVSYVMSMALNTGANRAGEIYILPKAIYDELGGEQEAGNNLLESDWMSVKAEYAQYLATKVTQLASGASFSIGSNYGQGLAGAELVKLSASSPEAQEHGTTNIYTLTLENATSTIINTLGYDPMAENSLNATVEPTDASWVPAYPEASLGEFWSFTYNWEGNSTDSDRNAVIKFTYPEDKPEDGIRAGDTFGVVIVTQKKDVEAIILGRIWSGDHSYTQKVDADLEATYGTSLVYDLRLKKVGYINLSFFKLSEDYDLEVVALSEDNCFSDAEVSEGEDGTIESRVGLNPNTTTSNKTGRLTYKDKTTGAIFGVVLVSVEPDTIYE